MRWLWKDGSAVKLADGFGEGGGLAWDWWGRLYLGDTKAGRVSVIPRPDEKAVALPSAFQAPAGLALAKPATLTLPW